MTRQVVPAVLVACLLTPLLVAAPAAAQEPFACTGESFISQRQPSQLFRFFQSNPAGFAFSPVGLNADNECDEGDVNEPCNLQFPDDTFIEVNNLAFRSTDGLLYAVHLNPTNSNLGIVKIDSEATVFGVGTPLNTGGTWPNVRLDAGDISQDGNQMYVNQAGLTTQFAIVDLTMDPPEVVAAPTIMGASGIVNDWTYNRIDGNLYGGDRDGGSNGGQVARLNLAAYLTACGDPPTTCPATIVRQDFDVDGCMGTPPEGRCDATELPHVPSDPGASGAFGAFGGAWFNASGTLFLYRNLCQPGTGEPNPCAECGDPTLPPPPGAPTTCCNPGDPNPPSTCPDPIPADPYQANGKLYRIDLTSFATPRIIRTRIGRTSEGFNDSAACIRFPRFGPAKRMTATCGLPATVTIEYVVENFEMSTVGTPDTELVVSNVSAIEDLSAVFGTPDVANDGNDDWNFLSISSVPAGFANPNFNGGDGAAPDPELVAPNQSLGPQGGMPPTPPSQATITVVIEVRTLNNAGAGDLPDPPPPPGSFCNQVLFTGVNFDGTNIGDLSTEGLDPDPDGDGEPDEALISCVTLADPAVTLVKDGAFDDGGDGLPDPGDLINYTFMVSNPANVGAVTLENLLVSDPLVGAIDCSPLTNGAFSLDPGQMATCIGSYAITAGDIPGTVINTAMVTGTPFLPDPPFPPPFGDTCPPVDATDDHTEPIPEGGEPCLDLVKSCDPDLGPDGIADPGEIIDYEFVVSNCSDVVPLTDVFIDDPMVTVDCAPLTNGAITLDPMMSATCAGTYVITQADIDAGEKCNFATATGNDPTGLPVESPLAESCCELPIFEIPTLGHLGLLLLALGLAGLGLRRLRRRR